LDYYFLRRIASIIILLRYPVIIRSIMKSDFSDLLVQN